MRDTLDREVAVMDRRKFTCALAALVTASLFAAVPAEAYGLFRVLRTWYGGGLNEGEVLWF